MSNKDVKKIMVIFDKIWVLIKKPITMGFTIGIMMYLLIGITYLGLWVHNIYQEYKIKSAYEKKISEQIELLKNVDENLTKETKKMNTLVAQVVDIKKKNDLELKRMKRKTYILLESMKNKDKELCELKLTQFILQLYNDVGCRRNPAHVKEMVRQSFKMQIIIKDEIKRRKLEGKKTTAFRIKDAFRNVHPALMTLGWIHGESGFTKKIYYKEKDKTTSWGCSQVNDVNIKNMRKFFKNKYGFTGKESIYNIRFNIACNYKIWCDRIALQWRWHYFDNKQWNFLWKIKQIMKKDVCECLRKK